VINPDGKRLGRAAMRPAPPQRAYNGGKEAIEIQRRTREASRSCGVAPFNRVFDGCAQRGQHDCDRSHIRVGAAVLIRSQAMVVTEVHYELLAADLCDGDHAGHSRIRRRSQ
jgi:hypothetical protein